MMIRKKILFIHHGSGIGGAPHSLRLLIRSLDTKEFEPVVLFLFDSPAVKLFTDEGIAVAGPVLRAEFSHTVIWWYRWYHVHHFLRALWDWVQVLFFDAGKWFDELKPDIVHLNTSSLSVWALVAWWKHIPVVWHIRESLASGYMGLRRMIIQSIVERCATKIIAISTYDGRFWKNSKKLVILQNPVDCQFFSPNIAARKQQRELLNIPQEANVLVYLGGLSREKGALLALRILERLLVKNHDFYLIVAGSWKMPTESKLRTILGLQQWYRQVNQLAQKMAKNIRFTGVVESTHHILQTSDCLVFPAQKGHFARPVLEAGAVGLPVVASHLSPLEELVEDQETGFLCDPGDLDVWERAILTLFEQKAGAFNFVRKKIEDGFGLEPYGKKITVIYRSLGG
ncbi:glycosyltransferase family 4 protein [Candidatus Dependentiae bacterium]|nr:glycosyltransferase family 4 protein [Candidatus Dependentiae bacterium]